MGDGLDVPVASMSTAGPSDPTNLAPACAIAKAAQPLSDAAHSGGGCS